MNVVQTPWSKREVFLTVVISGCLIGWYFVDVNNETEFRNKTHQVEVGMSLQKAVAILGEPTKRREKQKGSQPPHDARPRWAELGKENPIMVITWDGPAYDFYVFVVSNEIIATRTHRAGSK